MIEMLKTILQGALERLHAQATQYLPSLLAAVTLVLAAYLVAAFARWLIYRTFKGLSIDRFLRQSGVAFLVDPCGRLRATRLVAESAFWCILLVGVLSGINVFGADLSNRIVQGFVFLLPKLFIAGLILLVGAWLGHYLGRELLVWAVNENFPSPRRLATVVRILIMFVAVVVAADQLDFARHVFLAAFIILVGGAVLAASLALGLGTWGGRRLFDRSEPSGDSAERSLWSHL
jgi:hypothetical protein